MEKLGLSSRSRLRWYGCLCAYQTFKLHVSYLLLPKSAFLFWILYRVPWLKSACLFRFLFKFTGNETEINLLGDGSENPEFSEWKWVPVEEVIKNVWLLTSASMLLLTASHLLDLSCSFRCCAGRILWLLMIVRILTNTSVLYSMFLAFSCDKRCIQAVEFKKQVYERAFKHLVKLMKWCCVCEYAPPEAWCLSSWQNFNTVKELWLWVLKFYLDTQLSWT